MFMKACERAAVKKRTFSGFQFFVNVERSDERKNVCVRRLVHPQKSSTPVSVKVSILITYLITLSQEKEIIVLGKCLKKVPNFVSQKLYSKPGI